MSKLFSLEAKDPEDSGLLIDKVLKQQEVEKGGLQVTADLIKQRHQLRSQIEEELKKKEPDSQEEEESEGESDEASDESQEDTDGEKKEDSGEDSSEEEEEESQESSDSEKDDEEKQKDEETDEQEEDEDEEESVGSTQTADDASALIGAAHKGKSKDDKESEDKPATESASLSFLRAPDIFAGILRKKRAQQITLESYGLKDTQPDAKAQPLAYVQEDVIKGLDTLVAIATKYVARNTERAQALKQGILEHAESVTVYEECLQAKRLHLTLKVVDDPDILRNVCSNESTTLKESVSAMARFMEDCSAAGVKLLSEPLGQVPARLQSSNFKESESGEFTYHHTLPGFHSVHAAVEEYRDYLHTKFEDYEFYRTQNVKPQELYALSGVSIEKESELVLVLQKLQSLCVSCALFADNLSDMSQRYNALIDQLKALRYDVEKGAEKNLADLGLDAHLQHFISFKLASELYALCCDLGVEFVTSCLSVLGAAAELDAAQE